MKPGKGTAQALARSRPSIKVRYYYLLTFKRRRGDGTFGVPISPFLVSIRPRPSFEVGSG